MNDYISLRIECDPCSGDTTDLLAAFLADFGYESFVPDDKGLTAYIRKEDFNESDIASVIESFPMECGLEASWDEIEGEDWNAEWEKNYFKPIVIGNECVVHSSFHTDVPAARIDITVDPRMAFGTGHHSTTRLMMEGLLKSDLKGKSVIDMGTGTAILSILAAKLGASEVTGIEIDPQAAQNAAENCCLNGVDVKIITGDAAALGGLCKADIFLANINRNIILADLAEYVGSMKKGAQILLSGFFVSDADVVKKMAHRYGLELMGLERDNEWAVMRFRLPGEEQA